MNYTEFEKTQRQIMLKNLNHYLEANGMDSLHALNKYQGILISNKLTEEERNGWIDISKNTLYNLHSPDANPNLETLIKISFLLGIELGELFKNKLGGKNNEQ